MEYVKINLARPGKKEIDLIVNFLNKGKVIVYPTDTVYGLGCPAGNIKAIKKIYQIKKRDRSRPLIVLVSGLAMAKQIARINARQLAFLKKVWPGPVSVILEAKGNLPKVVSGGQKTLALRFPDNGFLQKIIKKIKGPLVSTSFNISGEPQIKSPKNLEKIFAGKKPDLVIDAGVLNSKPSKLVDLREADRIKILRK